MKLDNCQTSRLTGGRLRFLLRGGCMTHAFCELPWAFRCMSARLTLFTLFPWLQSPFSLSQAMWKESQKDPWGEIIE